MVLLSVLHELWDGSPVTGANGAADGVITGAICSTGAWTGSNVEVPAGDPVSSTGVVAGAMTGVSSVEAESGTSTSQGREEAG